MSATSQEDRFWAKVQKTDGCWLWTAYRHANGYGRFNAGRVVYAHRWAYERQFGPVPEGLYLDHLCRVRRCVNPDHLEVVTSRENTLRGNSIPARNAAKTHCKNGHEFNEENTRHSVSGRRYCRACVRAEKQRRKARKAASG